MLRTQSQQKRWSPVTHELPLPKFGMTGPSARGHRSSSTSRERRTPSARRRRRRRRAGGRRRVSSISETALRTVVRGATRVAGPRSPYRASSCELAERPEREPAQRAVLADELRHELVGRVREDRVGRVVLREHAALAQDRDPVAHRDRLVDVVGDEDDRLRRPRGAGGGALLEPARVIGSSAPNGSSIRSSGGSAASARASPTRWRCPPESCAG